MNTEELAFRKPILKVKKIKKQKRRHKKYNNQKFDKEKFLIAMGLGIVVSIIGTILIWRTKNSSAEDSLSATSSYSYSIQHILPESTSDLLLFLFGNLLMIFGLICIFIAIKIFARFLSDKLKR